MPTFGRMAIEAAAQKISARIIIVIGRLIVTGVDRHGEQVIARQFVAAPAVATHTTHLRAAVDTQGQIVDFFWQHMTERTDAVMTVVMQSKGFGGIPMTVHAENLLAGVNHGTDQGIGTLMTDIAVVAARQMLADNLVMANSAGALGAFPRGKGRALMGALVFNPAMAGRTVLVGLKNIGVVDIGPGMAVFTTQVVCRQQHMVHRANIARMAIAAIGHTCRCGIRRHQPKQKKTQPSRQPHSTLRHSFHPRTPFLIGNIPDMAEANIKIKATRKQLFL